MMVPVMPARLVVAMMTAVVTTVAAMMTAVVMTVAAMMTAVVMTAVAMMTAVVMTVVVIHDLRLPRPLSPSPARSTSQAFRRTSDRRSWLRTSASVESWRV